MRNGTGSSLFFLVVVLGLGTILPARPANPGRIVHVHDTSANPFLLPHSGKEVGDPFPVYWDGVWHLYALRKDLRAVLHFTSTDLVTWAEREPAMVGRGIATGTVVRHDNKFYLFYTDAGPQTIRLVVSENPWYFDFGKSRLVAEPDEKQYTLKQARFFRDIYVFYYEKEKLWWMIPEARCPEVCAGLFKSKDLLAWEQHEPIFRDASRQYGSCPQVFEHQGRWYLTCLDYNTWYYTADFPYGPWQLQGYYHSKRLTAASRLASDGNRWVGWGFFTRHATPEAKRDGYGGPLGVGRELVFHEDATIGVRPLPELIDAIRQPADNIDLFPYATERSGRWTINPARQTFQCIGERGGSLLFDLPEQNPDYYFEADIELARPEASASLVVRTSKSCDRGYRVLVEPGKKKVAIRQFASDGGTFDERDHSFPGVTTTHLQVFVCGHQIEVFVDGRTSLSARVENRSDSRLALEIAGGEGAVRQPLLHYFRLEKQEPADPAIGKAMEALQADSAVCREDPTRPVCHFRPPARWMNDICGAIFHKGYYHIFYQLNPYGDEWGSDGTCWGHARSRDLVRWEHLPIALHPMTARGERRCNSGSVAINAEGTPMIFYTFVPKHAQATRLGKREQWAAMATDDELRTWRRVKENPLLAAGTNGVPPEVNGGWSDPFVFKVDGRTFATFKSCGGLVAEAKNPTLTEWECVGRMDSVSGECPNFFRLGDMWVLLRSTYPPSYRLGRFDPERIAFVETEGKGGTLDYVYGPKRPGPWSRGFYGTNVLFDDRGRCVLFGWVSGFKTGRRWNGCMSLPRIITLDDNGNLLQTPAPELAKLRGDSLKVENVVVANESKAIRGAEGDTIELIAEFGAGDARAFGLKLRCSKDGKNALVLRHDREKLRIGGADVPAPIDRESRRLKLHVFLDKSVMEVFVNDGRACVTQVVYPGQDDLGLEVFAEGGRVTLLSLDVWQLSSIWPRSTGPAVVGGVKK